MVQINGSTFAKNKKKEMNHYINDRKTVFNQMMNFYETQPFTPQTFMSQAFTPQTFKPQTFAFQTSVPQTFTPQKFSLQTFASQIYAPQAFGVQTIVPQAIASQTIAPQAIPCRTLRPQTYASQSLSHQTSSPRTLARQVTAPQKSASRLIKTTQQSQEIQQNQPQSNAVFSHETVNENVNDRPNASNSCPTPDIRSLISIWTYMPYLLPSGTFPPVTILTPWYGASWKITNSYDMEETCIKSSACDSSSHVRTNSEEKSNEKHAEADILQSKLSSNLIKSLWDVTISELYEKYAPQKPQHQSETNTISVREQHELLSKDLMNLSGNELIPSIQIGKKIIYTHKSVELQHEMNHLGQLQKQLLQRRPIMCRN